MMKTCSVADSKLDALGVQGVLGKQFVKFGDVSTVYRKRLIKGERRV